MSQRPIRPTQATRTSLRPLAGANRSLRNRLDLKGELMLAIAPTVTILSVLALVEMLSRQRLLFTSLAASAFLIYLDPHHATNKVRTLVLAQMMAATIGLTTHLLLGGYLAGGSAMVLTIVLMILLDAMHPPAVATSLSFGLSAGHESNLALFGLAVGITALLVLIERFTLWLLAQYSKR